MTAVLTLRRDRHVWTDDDVQTIIRMRREGAVDADIVAALGVTRSSYDMRIHRLLKERNLDLPRANRPDWGQPWTDERDRLLASLRNEHELYDDEIAELLGVTRAKMVTRIDYLRDLGVEVKRARKGRKPGMKLVAKPAAVPTTRSAPTLVPPIAPPEPVVASSQAVAVVPQRLPVPVAGLDRAATLRRDLARRRHRCTDDAERVRLGAVLLDALDLEEELADVTARMAAAESRLTQMETLS